MADNITKKEHGGARLGAGRPRAKEQSRLYTFRASGEMARFIDDHEPKTEFIKKCIAQEMAGAEQEPSDLEQGDAGLGQEPSGLEQERSVFEQTSLSKLGAVYPDTVVKAMNINVFDIGIVAGFPVPLDNDEKAQSIELLQMLCPCPEASYLIRVEGNSMIDAGICSGDIVIVDKSNRNPLPSEMAVCELNGEYTLKRFEMRDGTGWLIPANPDYPEIKVTADDSFSIWGTVSYIIHKPH